MRNDHRFRKLVEIVVIGTQFLLGIQMPSAVKIAQVFLLLGIKTDDRATLFSKFTHQQVNLFSAMRDRFHRFLLLRFAAAIVMFLEQFVHDTLADVDLMILIQHFGNLLWRQVSPNYFLVHWITGGMLFQHTQKLGIYVLMALIVTLAPASNLTNRCLVFRFIWEFG